jgi:hypothetical protein
VEAFALRAEDAQELDRLSVGIAEPVREVGVEFRDLAASEIEVLAAEDHAQSPVEDIQPVVSLVRARVWFEVGWACRQDVLEDLQSAGLVGVSGMMVMPLRMNDRGYTLGSPLAGAPTSSSSGIR